MRQTAHVGKQLGPFFRCPALPVAWFHQQGHDTAYGSGVGDDAPHFAPLCRKYLPPPGGWRAGIVLHGLVEYCEGFTQRLPASPDQEATFRPAPATLRTQRSEQGHTGANGEWVLAQPAHTVRDLVACGAQSLQRLAVFGQRSALGGNG